MSFGLTMKVKDMFFDRPEIVREVGKLNAAALYRAGKAVRTTARKSLKRRKGPSAPGQPPHAHASDSVSGNASLRRILFAYDRIRQSVVIGPVLLPGRRVNVPALHEFGGTGLGRRVRTTGKGRQAKRRAFGKVTRVQYPARPFMGPALIAEAPKFPSLWVSSGRAAA